MTFLFVVCIQNTIAAWIVGWLVLQQALQQAFGVAVRSGPEHSYQQIKIEMNKKQSMGMACPILT
jgi:hypothetical protein